MGGDMLSGFRGLDSKGLPQSERSVDKGDNQSAAMIRSKSG